MKSILTVALFLLVAFPLALSGQIAPAGGGAYAASNDGPCLAEGDRAEIRDKINANITRLRAAGKIPATDQKMNLSIDWPLRPVGIDWPNYYGISNYVDLNTSSGIQDYECQQRSYDGHNGTDFFTWPFPYYLKDLDAVEVIAVAPGTIIGKDDGESDENCVWGNQRWNAVYVRHDNGTVAWYGHLKRNSLTEREVGARLETGDYIGVVASSGRSDGPHLHLEFQSIDGSIIDPYSGNCNENETPLISWREQQPYQEPTINAVLLHSAPPVHDCPGTSEFEYLTDTYSVGEELIVGAYFKDQISGDLVTYRILRPDGTEEQRWTQRFDRNFNGSWWWFPRNIGIVEPTGVYVVEATLRGDTVRRAFNYGTTTSTSTPQSADFRVYPNPVASTLNFPPELRVNQMSVVDLRGSIVREIKVTGGSQVSVEGLSPGVYVLVLGTTDGGVYRLRIVKH